MRTDNTTRLRSCLGARMTIRLLPTRYGFLIAGDVVYASIGARELAVLRGDKLVLRRPETTVVAQVNLLSGDQRWRALDRC